MDLVALNIAYQTDFQKKLNPGLYNTQASASILELLNGANFMKSNVDQTAMFSIASYLCYLSPYDEGCEKFNDIGCWDGNRADCASYSTHRTNELASLCTVLADGEKTQIDGCFIVSLRETADGGSRDHVTPWNNAVQDWVDSHNCTSIMYHLKYRCYSNLIKWNEVTAQEEYVDLDKLFDATFGITAVSEVNYGDPFECSSLSDRDRETLITIAQIHAEAAVKSFLSTALSLARFGVSAADVMYRQKGAASFIMPDVMIKLRTTLLLNLFYDGVVQPFREWCCAKEYCFDYHPMDVLSHKVESFNILYPDGADVMADNSAVFANTPSVGKFNDGMDGYITKEQAYVFSVLKDAPTRSVFAAATGADLDNVEAF